MTEPDYYGILGLASDATDREIQHAYHRLARRHHPDANPPDEDDRLASEHMALINRAYAVLGDPQARTEYDRKRQSSRPPVEDTPGDRPHAKWSDTVKWTARLASLSALAVLVALGGMLILHGLWLGEAMWLQGAIHWLSLDTSVGRRAWALVAIGAVAMILAGRKLAEW